MVEADAWGQGAYREMAFTMLPLVGRLVETARVAAGERVLDVGCGSGTVAITAARQGARVTGLDITPRMLDLAREDAGIAGVEVDWREGDAEKMPFDDASFDVVLSNMGVIFAPDAQAAADEMLRVLRPGGRLAFTCWERRGAMGELHRVIDEATGSTSTHLRWSDAGFAAGRFGSRVSDLNVEPGDLARNALTTEHVWESVSRAAPPVVQAVAKLSHEGRTRLREAYVEAARPFHRGTALHQGYVMITARKA